MREQSSCSETYLTWITYWPDWICSNNVNTKLTFQCLQTSSISRLLQSDDIKWLVNPTTVTQSFERMLATGALNGWQMLKTNCMHSLWQLNPNILQTKKGHKLCPDGDGTQKSCKWVDRCKMTGVFLGFKKIITTACDTRAKTAMYIFSSKHMLPPRVLLNQNSVCGCVVIFQLLCRFTAECMLWDGLLWKITFNQTLIGINGMILAHVILLHELHELECNFRKIVLRDNFQYKCGNPCWL